ncbi:uncharacterized protein [Drosophila virilis]|uniref:uncharacterized protein n=1 Tax=Drosophila virilis TaxID=7244 RepID=UPI001395CB14|nr:fibrous sheath CABYR-binding protein [Drosophila virilis]
MYVKVCVLLLAIGLSQALPNSLLPDVGLMQFMMKSRDLSQDNPARSLSCFDTYLPLLNDISQDFQKAYAQCLATADASRLGIDDNTKDDRDKIDSEATSACDALTTCSQSTAAIDYFECYSQTGSENTKVMYTISANSAELLAQVREEYRLIDIVQYECTNKSERAYVENTAATYENLDRCLAGLEPLTTTSAPTTAPTVAPTTAPTEAPAESTPGPTTAAPAESTPGPTTAAPAESTPGPTTAAPAESTPGPTTAAPAESTPGPTTAAPVESTPGLTTAADLPEEDLSKLSEQQNKLKQMMDEMKKWFNRH